MFKAKSYTANKKYLYGYSIDITRPFLDNRTALATCLEYIGSDVMNNGSLINNTYIVTRPIGCQFVKSGHDLDLYQGPIPISPAPLNKEWLVSYATSHWHPFYFLSRVCMTVWVFCIGYHWQRLQNWRPRVRVSYFLVYFSSSFALHYDCAWISELRLGQLRDMSKKIGEFSCQSGLLYFFFAERGKFVNLGQVRRL